MRVFTLLAISSALLCLAHCGGSDPSSGPVAPTFSFPDAGALDDGAASPDGGPSDAKGGPQDLFCNVGVQRLLFDIPSDDAGHDVGWRDRMRLLRLGPTLSRAVIHAEGSSPELVSFDPTAAQPSAVRTALPIDVVLDTAHQDGALYVYGLIRGGSPDAGVGSDTDSLALVWIDDASGAITTKILTAPGALGLSPTHPYERPQGRFVRFGSAGVYFTYTEEVGVGPNPDYRLSVGRASTADSVRVPVTVAGTSASHEFERITVTGVAHGGSSVYLFMGGSTVSNSLDEPRNATEWTLPDDGTVPAMIPSRDLDTGVLAVARDGTTTRFLFAEAPTIFGDPRYLGTAAPDDMSLATFKPTSTSFTVANDSVQASNAEAHFENGHFLWLNAYEGLWFDTAVNRVRASFRPIEITSGHSIAAGALALAAAPTATSATLDVLYAVDDSNATHLEIATLSCAPPK
ncbi:MAG: hypothetical protein JWO86_2388 [Myxococcaceae bacterium]|jgi:hypothetical protein|nr:hypothetical protein [Myxococcaceae bacterium]